MWAGIVVVFCIVAGFIWLGARAAYRSEHFYIHCPMCGRERKYGRAEVIQRVNTLSAAEIIARDRDSLRCAKWARVFISRGREGSGSWQWSIVAGCGADMIWLYMSHPFVRECFRNKATLIQAEEITTALMEAETLPDNVRTLDPRGEKVS